MITGKCKARHSWKKTQSTHPRALRRDSWLDLTCEAFSSNCAISRSPIWRTKKSSPHCSKCPSPNDILKQDTVHFNLPFIHFYIQQLHLNCLPLIRTKYYENHTISIAKSKYKWSRKRSYGNVLSFLIIWLISSIYGKIITLEMKKQHFLVQKNYNCRTTRSHRLSF